MTAPDGPTEIERLRRERDEARAELALAKAWGAQLAEWHESLAYGFAVMSDCCLEVERSVYHARFMGAGWKRRAKESRQNALTGARWVRELRAEAVQAGDDATLRRVALDLAELVAEALAAADVAEEEAS
jgi:hypothetical protein